MRPNGFSEWRSLLHQTIKLAGMILMSNWHRKDVDRYYRSRGFSPQRRGKQTVLTKELYKLAHRAYRIEQHMNAEMEARTSSAMKALMDMLRSEFGKDDQ